MRQAVMSPILRGRGDEMRALAVLLGRASRGSLWTAFVEGEPGIGKSRLLADALRLAEHDGFRAFFGRGAELGRSQPFGALLEAFGIRPGADDPERARIGRLLASPAGECARPPPELAEYQLVEAFLDLVERAALEAPVALAVDDLQWADAATLLTLRAVATRLRDLPILLLCAYRPWPAWSGQERLVAPLVEAGGVRVELAPLDERAVAAIAADALAAQPGPALLELLAGTRGNPLFVVELLRALTEEGSLEERDGYADSTAPELPPTLRLTILRRLSALGEEALETLRIAAILGSAFAVEDIAAVLGESAIELLSRLDEGRRLGIVEERGERLAFRHDLIREALYEDIPPNVRRALHRDAARALAAAGAPPLRAAEQFLLSASPGDREAVEWLRRAAREVAASAKTTAIELLDSAFGLCEPGSQRRAELAAELSVLLVIAGRSQEVEALRRDFGGAADPSVEASFEIAQAEALWNRGDIAATREHFERAAALPPAAGPQRSIAAAFAAQQAVLLGDAEGAIAAATKALSESDPAVGVEAEVVALETLTLASSAMGHFDEAVELGKRASELATGVDSEWAPYLYPLFYLAPALIELDRFDDARAALRAGRENAESVGNVSWLQAGQWLLAAIDLAAGTWQDALAEVDTGLALASEIDNSWGVVFAHAIAAQIAVHQGELDAAERRLEAAERTLEETGLGLGIDWMLWAQARLAEARGSSAEALTLLVTAWEVAEPFRYFLAFRSIGPQLVRLAVRHGDDALAGTATAEVEEGARRSSVPSVEAAALRCRGMLERSPEIVLEGARAARSGARPLELALACEEAAELLATCGRPGEAAGLLDEALDVHEHLGAAHDAGRVAAALRALGARRGARGPRRRPQKGWESLTATEQRVARLAAQRLTNGEIGERLFVSKRTIQTHLGHIFAKLDIDSRRHLAAHLPPG